MSLTTEKITVAAADAQMRNSGGTAFEQWNVLLSRMTTGDDIVRYSDVDVYRGFCSGD